MSDQHGFWAMGSFIKISQYCVPNLCVLTTFFHDYLLELSNFKHFSVSKNLAVFCVEIKKQIVNRETCWISECKQYY